VGEEAVDAGDSDIVEMLDAVAHEFGGDDGFFGDGDVAGAGGDNRDHALAVELAVAVEGDGSGFGAVGEILFEAGAVWGGCFGLADFFLAVLIAAILILAILILAISILAIFMAEVSVPASFFVALMVGAFRKGGANGLELFFGGAGREDVAVFVMGGKVDENLCHLGGRFALAENHLGHALAEGTVVIDLGEAEVFEGEMAKALDGLVGGELFGANFVEEAGQGGGVHVMDIVAGSGIWGSE